MRKRGVRTPLLSFDLTNLHSLINKMIELLLLNRKNPNFSNSAVLCFTETCFNQATEDNILEIPGFHIQWQIELQRHLGKRKERESTSVLNNHRCTDVTALKKFCSVDLFINCKLFYAPQEFSSFLSSFLSSFISTFIPCLHKQYTANLS